MKKFISALSSLVIAATAMGGALAISTDAASTPDSTIVAFRSNGESSVKAKAGDTVPVAMYIPQSQGFNTLTVKASINGGATLDQGSVKDMNGKVIENYKGSFGNYGITISDVAWPAGAGKKDPCCLDSGILSGNKMFAGYAKAGTALFTEDAYNIMYQAGHAVQYTAAKFGLEAGSKDIDSYTAWEAAGSPAYDGYTPVFTWSKDEAWDTYKYPLVTFNLNLPSNLKDGTYVFDVYYDEYLNCNPSALFDSKTNEELPESKRTYASSSAKGIGGVNTLKSEKLTITVGEPPQGGETTTTTSVTTTVTPDKATTTVKQDDPKDPAGAIVYDLKTANSKLSGNKNTVTVKPGEKIDVLWTVSKDQKIAGMQMYFDLSQIIAAGGKYLGAEQGDAYMLIPTFNDQFAGMTREENENGGQIIYTFGGNDEFIADADGALIYTFQIQAPEKAGTYNIVNDTSRGDVTKVTPRVGDPLSFVIHELAITVDGDEPQQETTTTVTTPAPQQETTTTVTTPAPQQETTTTTATPDDGDVLYGDVNCDKQVRINDVVLLNRYLAKTADVTAQGKKNADCVKDGNITADDSTAIKEFLARLIPSLPKQ
jgi:hypothetical protein